jgi:hypothetical protein
MNLSEMPSGFYSGDTIKLVRATDSRYNDHCDPPQAHLGKRIPYYEEPLDIGELALVYLRSLVAEAATLL